MSEATPVREGYMLAGITSDPSHAVQVWPVEIFVGSLGNTCQIRALSI